MNRLTTRLAAHAGTRQVRAALLADRAALAAERSVQQSWQRLLALLADCPGPGQAFAQARELGLLLRLQAVQAITHSLGKIAGWSYRGAVRQLTRSVPRAALARVALRRRQVREAITLDFGEVEHILFPPPGQDLLSQILFGSGWYEHFQQATKLASPGTVAGIIASGLARGENQQQIARQLLPVVDGVRSTAKRLARTEGMRVAGAAQMAAHQQLGDLVAGYQIHASLDQHTRPEHAHRSGTVYWKNPKPGQLGYDRMPHPPQEADGSTAWNCLLPGNVVQGRFVGGSKARYSGKAIEVMTASGLSVRVTANHPILTEKGFIPAQCVKEGNHLIRYVSEINRFPDNEQNAPATVEDVFCALAKFPGIIPIRPAVFEFHGDELGKKIDATLRP